MTERLSATLVATAKTKATGESVGASGGGSGVAKDVWARDSPVYDGDRSVDGSGGGKCSDNGSDSDIRGCNRSLEAVSKLSVSGAGIVVSGAAAGRRGCSDPGVGSTGGGGSNGGGQSDPVLTVAGAPNCRKAEEKVAGGADGGDSTGQMPTTDEAP